MIKQILLIFILFIPNLFADITKPYSMNIVEQYDGGKLLYTKNDSLNIANQQFYLIKKNFINDNETIYKWKGIQRELTQGESFNNIDIIDAIYFQNKLMMIVKENNNVFISLFDGNNNISMRHTVSLRQNTKWVGNYKDNKLFLLNDNVLYEVVLNNDIHLISIAENILTAKIINNREDYILSYIVDRNDIGLLYLLNSDIISEYTYKAKYISRIQITNNTNIFNVNNYIVIINSIADNSNIYVSLFDINTKTIVESSWINTSRNLFSCDDFDNNWVPNQVRHNNKNNIRQPKFVLEYPNLYAITNHNDNYYLNKIHFNFLSDTTKWSNIKLPSNLYKPQKMIKANDKLFIFFSNYLLIMDEDLKEIALNNFDFSVFNNNDFAIDVFDDYFIISSNNLNCIYKLTNNNLWWFYKYLQLTYKFAIPICLILIVFIFYRVYRNQKRLLDVIIELPSSGFLFIVNRVGKLIKINEGGKQLLGLTDNVPKRKYFINYCKLSHLHHINDLIELGLKNKYPFQQKINIIENNVSTEWLCSLFPLNNITGMFKGVILTGVDITEALEKQMLTNWAQLAHDMQTNLSIIRLNAEQLDISIEKNIDRKNKILHQITILVHRIRDIVTVGRDDKLELINTNSIDFCNEIRNEFDDNIFSNIKFKMELNDFNFLCDKSKLSRALRNAVENSIKYMKNKGGTITMSCSKDIHSITLSVKDTGVGMDETTKKKIFTPFYSTTRQLGGHGIGTMIMQKVIEQHGGKLIIESQLGIGTEIIFLIPDLSRKGK